MTKFTPSSAWLWLTGTFVKGKSEFFDSQVTHPYSLSAAPWMVHWKSAEGEYWFHLIVCRQPPAAGSWEPCPWPGQPPDYLPGSSVMWSGLCWSQPSLSPAEGRWGLRVTLLPWLCSPSCTAGTNPWVSAPGSDSEESWTAVPRDSGTKSYGHGHSQIAIDWSLLSGGSEDRCEMFAVGGHLPLGGCQRARKRDPWLVGADHHWPGEAAPAHLLFVGHCSPDRCSGRRREHGKGEPHLSGSELGSPSVGKSVVLEENCIHSVTEVEICTTVVKHPCCLHHLSAQVNWNGGVRWCLVRAQRAAHGYSGEGRKMGGDPLPLVHNKACSTIGLHKAWLKQGHSLLVS